MKHGHLKTTKTVTLDRVTCTGRKRPLPGVVGPAHGLPGGAAEPRAGVAPQLAHALVVAPVRAVVAHRVVRHGQYRALLG